MRKRVIPIGACILVCCLAEASLGERQEIYGRWHREQLTTAPLELTVSPRPFGRLGTFDGLIGGRTTDRDSVAAYFISETGEFVVPPTSVGSAVSDISDNGFLVISDPGEGGVVEIPPSTLLIDTNTGTQQLIRSPVQGFQEGPHVNNLGEVAFYNNIDGAWVWPQMVNLPIGEGYDPSSGHGELGLVTIHGLSDDGWVTGSISVNGPFATHAFMWNFHTDDLFRLREPGFENLVTRATAIGPDGWTIVEVNPSGPLGQTVEAAYRWDGTTLEPLDPASRVFVGRFPMVDVNASGQAVGGSFVRINDAGQILEVRQGPLVPDPSCEGCLTRAIELWRGDPLHIEGDYDASGTVDQGDLDLVLLNWGSGDLPDDWYHDFPDLPIDQAELDTVLLRWGRSDGTPALTVQAAVPEPSALTLMLLLTSAVALRVRSSDRLLNSKS